MRERRWLWLEDRQDTVVDFRSQVEKRVSIEIVGSASDMILRIQELLNGGESPLSFGLVLDLMLINNPFLMSPSSWHGGEKVAYYRTVRNGYDGGMVFYEKLVLPHSGMPNPILSPPPPVVFLTVAHLDFEDLRLRFDSIKSRWASLHSVGLEESRVEWFRKWSAKGSSLGDLLEKWDC